MLLSKCYYESAINYISKSISYFTLLKCCVLIYINGKRPLVHIYVLCTCTYLMFASTWQRTGFRFLVSEGLATTMWLIGMAAILSPRGTCHCCGTLVHDN